MSEDQLKAADTDAALEQDIELSDEELAGVAGGLGVTVLARCTEG
jgi:hypothetical protein